MKVNEIIVEAEFDPYTAQDLTNPDARKEYKAVTEVQHLANIITTNCSQMLSAYQATDLALIRGVRESYQDSIIANIRPDRKPLYMGKKEHKILHTMFLKAGLPATRTNSIFCTTNTNIADAWSDRGATYVIFVKDGWVGTIFENVKKDYAFRRVGAIAGAEYMPLDRKIEELKALKPMVVTPCEFANGA